MRTGKRRYETPAMQVLNIKTDSIICASEELIVLGLVAGTSPADDGMEDYGFQGTLDW
jgi:hypothetical protein